MKCIIERASRIVQVIAPDLTVVSTSAAKAAFTNQVHILNCRASSGDMVRLAVKLLDENPENMLPTEAAGRARAEFYGLRLARAHNIPAPEPLYLDTTGHLLGTPGVVTRMVEGRQVTAPDNMTDWAESIAALLVRIHSIIPKNDECIHLYDGNKLGLYFLTGDWPSRSSGYPLSDRIFNAVRELGPRIETVPSVFVHMDYWAGNLLWHDNRITAVLDWDAAALGDPALDLASFRMNMYQRGMKKAADIFLNSYEAEFGTRTCNLGFWELARAARALPNPLSWITSDGEMANPRPTRDQATTNYCEFVENAIHKAYAGI